MNQTDNSRQPNDRDTKDFIHLMSVNQINIYAYIISIVGDSNDADDIMQNTSAFMWDRFSEFKSGTDFVSWGISIAYFKIKEFRKTNVRNQFSNELMEALHKKSQDNPGDMNLYLEALHNCLGKLTSSDLSLIKLRFESGSSVKMIARRYNSSVQAVYIKLSKIYGILGRCVKRSLIGGAIK